MQNETPQQAAAPADKNISFGNRLKAAREAMGLERKDIAAQLRLNEKFLVMMEKDRFAPDLPLTFARGYLKTYAKFLQIPEFETKKALETLKPRPGTQDNFPPRNLPQITTGGSYFMQLFTYLVVFTMVGLAGAWWYTHPNLPASILAENTFSFNKQATPSKTPTTANIANAAEQAPANMPIATEANKAPIHTVTISTDPTIDPISAPSTNNDTKMDNQTTAGTIANNTAAPTATTTAPTTTDGDLDISPPTNEAAPAMTNHAQANQKTPAYMSSSNDDPLEDKSNDTE